MSRVASGTLTAARRLREAGMLRTQAEATTGADPEAFGELLRSQLLTKEDLCKRKADLSAQRSDLASAESRLSGAITELRADTSGGLTSLRGELKEDIAGLDTRLVNLRAELYRMMGLQVFDIVALTVTLMKLLDRAAARRRGPRCAPRDSG